MLGHDKRVFLDSELSKWVLKHPDSVWPVVRKVSNAILEVFEEKLREDNEKFKNLIEPTAHIMYSDDTFARLGSAAQTPKLSNGKLDVDALIENYKKLLLSNDPSLLSIIMNLHAEFGGSVLKSYSSSHFSEETQTEESFRYHAVKLASESSAARAQLRNRFYLVKDRPRLEVYGPHPRTVIDQVAGIAGKAPYMEPGEAYIRAVDRLIEDENNDYVKSVKRDHLPFVAGPSGHAGILLRSALVLTDLNVQELQTYMMASVGMIVGGGMHTFHEIMLVAQQIGLPYEPGFYREPLPESFFNHPKFKELITNHPELLESGKSLVTLEEEIFKCCKRILEIHPDKAGDEYVKLGILLERANTPLDLQISCALTLKNEPLAIRLLQSSSDLSFLAKDIVAQLKMQGLHIVALELENRDLEAKKILDHARPGGFSQKVTPGKDWPELKEGLFNASLFLGKEFQLNSPEIVASI